MAALHRGLLLNGQNLQLFLEAFLRYSFSTYIETAPQPLIQSVPNYAFFSENQNEWVWRDLYDYGFIDGDGRGLDIPFLNEAHYPFKNVIFKLYSDESSFSIPDFYQITIEPLTDPCE